MIGTRNSENPDLHIAWLLRHKPNSIERSLRGIETKQLTSCPTYMRYVSIEQSDPQSIIQGRNEFFLVTMLSQARCFRIKRVYRTLRASMHTE